MGAGRRPRPPRPLVSWALAVVSQDLYARRGLSLAKDHFAAPQGLLSQAQVEGLAHLLVVGTPFPTGPTVDGTSRALQVHCVLPGPAWCLAQRKLAKIILLFPNWPECLVGESL